MLYTGSISSMALLDDPIPRFEGALTGSTAPTQTQRQDLHGNDALALSSINVGVVCCEDVGHRFGRVREARGHVDSRGRPEQG